METQCKTGPGGRRVRAREKLRPLRMVILDQIPGGCTREDKKNRE